MSQNAFADGDIAIKLIQAGVLPGRIPIPVLEFYIRPDKPRSVLEEFIPFWAVGRLAVVVYAYAETARSVAGGIEDATIQANVKADIRCNGKLVLLQAYSVKFHTSRNIRQVAESKILEVTGSGRWPVRTVINPPGTLERRMDVDVD